MTRHRSAVAPRPLGPAAGVGLLPSAAGVYLMRDARGRILYVGRSVNLRARVRSYWGAVTDRPRMRGMAARVAWVEPFLTASEHEAAFVERRLLNWRWPRYNRALGGMESEVWLRLGRSPASPRLEMIHEPAAPGDGRVFGPYLGGTDVQRAVRGLLRLYPIHLTASPRAPSTAEMGRARNVGPKDRESLAAELTAILERRPVAVGRAIAGLVELRDSAARALRFEEAAERQQQLRAVEWVTQTQCIAATTGPDLEIVAVGRAGSAAVRVVLEVQAGSVTGRSVHEVSPSVIETGPGDLELGKLAQANADLLAAMIAGGVAGPGLGRIGLA